MTWIRNWKEKREKKRLLKQENMPVPDYEVKPDTKAQDTDKKTGFSAETNTDKDAFHCKKCGAVLSKAETVANKYVCQECGYYFRVRTKKQNPYGGRCRHI